MQKKLFLSTIMIFYGFTNITAMNEPNSLICKNILLINTLKEIGHNEINQKTTQLMPMHLPIKNAIKQYWNRAKLEIFSTILAPMGLSSLAEEFATGISKTLKNTINKLTDTFIEEYKEKVLDTFSNSLLNDHDDHPNKTSCTNSDESCKICEAKRNKKQFKAIKKTQKEIFNGLAVELVITLDKQADEYRKDLLYFFRICIQSNKNHSLEKPSEDYSDSNL